MPRPYTLYDGLKNVLEDLEDPIIKTIRASLPTTTMD